MYIRRRRGRGGRGRTLSPTPLRPFSLGGERLKERTNTAFVLVKMISVRRRCSDELVTSA